MTTINDKNVHARDALIEFAPGPHKYTCKGEGGYVSVTTWLHSHFKPFDADAIIQKMNLANPRSKYYGKTPEEIKAGWDHTRDEAAAAGTAMHAAIEQWILYEYPSGDIRLAETADRDHAGGLAEEIGALSPHFMDFVRDHPDLKPYRTEWMVFDEDVRIAGSIDMVACQAPLNQSGIQIPSQAASGGGCTPRPPVRAKTGGGEGAEPPLVIYDWKRCKDIKKMNDFKEFALTECIDHLPDTNYWHYALQLNTYKAILEAKYNKKVAEMWLVGLHPSLPTYHLYAVPDLSEEVAALFALRTRSLLCEK